MNFDILVHFYDSYFPAFFDELLISFTEVVGSINVARYFNWILPNEGVPEEIWSLHAVDHPG